MTEPRIKINEYPFCGFKFVKVYLAMYRKFNGKIFDHDSISKRRKIDGLTLTEMRKMLSLVLIYGFIAEATAQGEHYTIFRKENRIGDEFNIPSKLCGNSNDTCVQHGAHSIDVQRCRCECPSSNPTFASNGSNWNCHDDGKTKQNEGDAFLKTYV